MSGAVVRVLQRHRTSRTETVTDSQTDVQIHTHTHTNRQTHTCMHTYMHTHTRRQEGKIYHGSGSAILEAVGKRETQEHWRCSSV